MAQESVVWGIDRHLSQYYMVSQNKNIIIIFSVIGSLGLNRKDSTQKNNLFIKLFLSVCVSLCECVKELIF